ncbi:MAG: nuclease superfamily protein [Marmoricola sp.]|nr:nuclease superfamily protein [Marmoricola sp.]
MTKLDWPAPAAEPISSISPSALSAFNACPRKLAFQRDPATRDLSKPSPRTALGNAAHEISELAAKGQPPGGIERQAWLAHTWNQLLARQAQKVADAWPGRQVPPVTQWEGLVATRVRILRKLAASPEVVAGALPAQAGPGFPWIERKLVDPDAGVFGTPDRVDVRNGQLRVVDLKSGVHQAEIQDGQRRQLLLYAHLVDVTCGQLPAVGVVEHASGKEESFPIDSLDVTSALQEARQAIVSFNAAVAAGEVPARPEASACKFCSFRSVCWSYWGSPDARSDRDIRGIVIDVPDAKSFNVDVGTGEILRIVATPGSAIPESDDEVVVLDVAPAGPSTVKMRWNSIVRLPESTAEPRYAD